VNYVAPGDPPFLILHGTDDLLGRPHQVAVDPRQGVVVELEEDAPRVGCGLGLVAHTS
jgi:hypothetical protein